MHKVCHRFGMVANNSLILGNGKLTVKVILHNYTMFSISNYNEKHKCFLSQKLICYG